MNMLHLYTLENLFIYMNIYEIPGCFPEIQMFNMFYECYFICYIIISRLLFLWLRSVIIVIKVTVQNSAICRLFFYSTQ